MTVATVALLASAGAFASSIDNVEASKRLTEAAVFAETVLEDLTAQEYTNLLSLDGNEFFDAADEASSNYRAELTVFQAAVGLRQIRLPITRPLCRSRIASRIWRSPTASWKTVNSAR